MKETKETRLNVRVTPEYMEDLKAFAASKNMNMSEFIIAATQAYMGKPNDLEMRVLELERQLTQIQILLPSAA